MFQTFSPKQLQVMTWWAGPAAQRYDAILCDGAIRSGKTLCMSVSFLLWAMSAFDSQSFAICGKTVESCQRNVITPLLAALGGRMAFRRVMSRNYLEVRYRGNTNRFYIFGGKDEGSAALIQGITLAGVLLDEVVLMPRSFVEQALARCSIKGSRFWFSCNPEHPLHWFYTEWVQKAREKRTLYLHFTMEDNPSLDEAVKRRYRSLYDGVFYDRFIRGEWVAATGLVYPMFDPACHLGEPPGNCTRYYVSCDYGTQNPMSMGLWGLCKGKWYRLREYYHDGRKSHRQLTDEEYYQELEALCGGLPIRAVIVDPSAASFIACIGSHGRFRVEKANNQVLPGIGRVASHLMEKDLLFSPSCKDTIREFQLYQWEEKAKEDRPVKENDHAMDDIRYFVSTVLEGQPKARLVDNPYLRR